MHNFIKSVTLIITLSLMSSSAFAEYASYGHIELEGLARNDFHLNPAGVENTMVCNVNGPDGFLTIRSGPGSKHRSKRQLERLAIVEVDTRQRKGRWIKVVTAYRTHTKNGRRLSNYKDLHVTGWAHDGYLCGFTDY